MLRLLRRVAVLALVASALLLTVPRALYHYGVLGPAAAARVDDARQAVAVARAYGASSDLPAMAAALRELAGAEAALGRKEHHQARDAAARAQTLAGQAQQAALIVRDAQRVKAKRVIDELDQRVDELEEIYSAKSKGVGPERARHLFSRMKHARATSAALVLAWEQADYDTVVNGEGTAVAEIEGVKKDLQS
jgi:hypothetical protein